MSIHVNFFCQFNQTGVGRHCENAFFSMSRNRPEGLAVEYVNNARDETVRRAIAQGRTDTDITLFFWRYPPALVRQVPGRRVLWWFFESDHLPHKWLDEIEPYDEIWAPSTWARDVLLAHRVAPGRVRVVESGVNTRIFRPAREPQPGFVFLLVGKYEGRKSVDETVEAFVAEFPAAQYPAVQLWLKADFPLFPDRVHALARRLAHDPRIRIVSGNFSDEQMALIYNRADAFVFPSKAEGFGLPLLEAIACGVPSITTHVSAQTVFLDRMPGLYAPVSYTVAPIVDPDYQHFYAQDYAGEGFGNWALPSVASLRQAMRAVHDDPEAWRERAGRAAAIMAEEFSWDAIARKALAGLQELHARLPA
jgi:glycosyltransferase involved in cell wall biosynthesis